jgi:hypothetical protein
MQRLAAWLVGMFLIAQFAGVVPRNVIAQPGAAAAALSYQHGHDHADHTDRHKIRHHHAGDQHGNIADQCCALHLLAGVVPLVMTATPAELASHPLALAPADTAAGIGASPLYRPPRSLASL